MARNHRRGFHARKRAQGGARNLRATSSGRANPEQRHSRLATIRDSVPSSSPASRRRPFRRPVFLSGSRPTRAPPPRSRCWSGMRGAAGGIQITASHNPYRWNGIKFKASYGSSASPAIVAQIEAELEKVLRDGVPSASAAKNLIHSLDVRAPYLETLEGSSTGTACAPRNFVS